MNSIMKSTLYHYFILGNKKEKNKKEKYMNFIKYINKKPILHHMRTKNLYLVGGLVVGLYALYKWQTKNAMTSTQKEQYFGKVAASSITTGGAAQSTLNPEKLLLPVTGGVYRVDPTDLNQFQRFYVQTGFYGIENGILHPSIIPQSVSNWIGGLFS